MARIPIAGWLVLGVLLACGPVGPLPGGRLSGTPTAYPADWSGVDALYELRAIRIEDEAEIERAIEALERRYDSEIDAERRARGWLFHLEPRT